MSVPRQIRVLIIDDEPMIRINLAAYLEDEDYDVLVAASAEQALQRLRFEAFDIAIVDMRLPGLDGNAFVIEASRLRPGMRFLIHTGSMEYQVPYELHPLGVSDRDVLLKPIRDMSILNSEIQRRITNQ